jgi:hypothetical protein
MVIVIGLIGLFLCVRAWAGVEMPTEMEGVVPVYPGAAVKAAMHVNQGAQAILETKSSPEDVILFYRREMTAKGWTVLADMTQETTMVIILKKGNHMLHVGADVSEEGWTGIVLNFQPQ